MSRPKTIGYIVINQMDVLQLGADRELSIGEAGTVFPSLAEARRAIRYTYLHQQSRNRGGRENGNFGECLLTVLDRFANPTDYRILRVVEPEEQT